MQNVSEMRSTLKVQLESHGEYKLFHCQNVFNAETSYSDPRCFKWESYLQNT